MTGRIAHVVATDAFAGVERHVCDTAGELAGRGWDVTVIGGAPDLMRANLPDQVTLRPGRTSTQVAAQLLRGRAYDLVHTHMTAAEAGAAALKPLRFQRWVSTRHFAQPRGSSALGRVARPWIVHGLDAQIAISQFVADAIDGPSVVVPNGVRASTRTPGPRERTVAVLQRLEPEKDTHVALRAWALAALPGWTLRICGRGSEEGVLRRLAGDLGVTDSVVFEGFVADPRAVMASACMVLAPAPLEPFGLSVVEAMAEATPVIAASGGAHLETLGQDAALFRAGDPAAAARLLQEYAASTPRREAYGQALQERYARLFTLGRQVDHLESVYADVRGADR